MARFAETRAGNDAAFAAAGAEFVGARPRALTDAERVLVLEHKLAEAKDLLSFLASAGYREAIERYRAVSGARGREMAPPEALSYFGAVRYLCGELALSIPVARSEASVRREYLAGEGES